MWNCASLIDGLIENNGPRIYNSSGILQADIPLILLR